MSELRESQKVRVALVFGGRNSEHAVSCVGAGNLLSAIDRDRYEVVPIGIATDGRWVLAADDAARLAISGGELPSVAAVEAPSGEVVPRLAPGGGGLMVIEAGRVPRELGSVDVVLPLLHGANGEDGTIQGLLELTGAAYVGAGVLASAVGMDKEYMKLVFTARGLPIGDYIVVPDRAWRLERDRVLADAKSLGWPLFVKPARAGSSVGVGKAEDMAGLVAAIEAAREHDPKVLVEAAIDGVEVEVGVLEGGPDEPPLTSLPAQVVVRGDHEFYDFEAKYLDDATQMRFPPDIPPDAAAEIRRLAGVVFEGVGCEGVARVDFFYAHDGRILVNEINTMPGMTPTSAFPQLWAASGVTMRELADRMIQTALRKRPGLR